MSVSGSEIRGTASESLPSDFESLFRLAGKSLWLTAFGIVRNRALADDIVQDAAVIGLNKFSTFQPGTSFAAWMGRIVHFVARNAARSVRRRRTSPLDERTADPPARAAGPDLPRIPVETGGILPADQEMFDDDVTAALAELSDAARVCLLLRTVEGLEYAEIARILEIPEGTAMSHVHRARQFLRGKLSECTAAARDA